MIYEGTVMTGFKSPVTHSRGSGRSVDSELIGASPRTKKICRRVPVRVAQGMNEPIACLPSDASRAGVGEFWLGCAWTEPQPGVREEISLQACARIGERY